MIEGKKILITGGAGFIATNLIKRLIDANRVIVYDNFSRNSLCNSQCYNHKNLAVIKGDIVNYLELKKNMPGDIDLVLHMAAIAGIDTVINNPVRTMEVNMIGTYNILKVIQELNLIDKIERILIFSTSEVFGVNAFQVDEKSATNLQPVGEARWTYAVSKLTGEHLAYSYHKQFNLPVVIIRPFNVYGPGQVGEGAIHHFTIRAIRNEPLTIYNGGGQIRSWCFINDMVNGILLCLENRQAIGEIFKIGNPRGTIAIRDLADKIIQLSDSKSHIIYSPNRFADVELRIPNIDKIKGMLGFDPVVDLPQGILETIQWYREQKVQ